MIQDEVGSHCPEQLAFETRWRKDDIKTRREAFRARLRHVATHLSEDSGRQRWVGAVRAGLIVADAVGSAVVRMDQGAEQDATATIDHWVQDCFSAVLTGDDIWTMIIKERIHDLRTRHRWNDSKGFAFGDERGFNEFQVKVADQGARACC